MVRMTARTRTLSVAAAGAALLSALLAVPSGAATSPLLCQSFGMSPDQRVAPSAMCIVATGTRDPQTGEELNRTLQIEVSHDHGRTWAAMKALGLPAIGTIDTPPLPNGGYVESEGTAPLQVVYSDGYATDHTVYLEVTGGVGGLYESIDDGDAWTLINAATAYTAGSITPYADGRAVPGGAPVTVYPLAVADVTTASPERIDGPVMRLENGANPAWSTQFVFAPRAYHGVQLLDVAQTITPSVVGDATSLRSCTLDVDCSTVLHDFGAGSRIGKVVVAGDFDRTGRVLVDEYVGATGRAAPGWLESTDGGRTFHRWAFVARANRDAARLGGDLPTIAVAANPSLPGVMVADIVYSTNDRREHVRDYVTHDDGRHWTVVRTAVVPFANEWRGGTLLLGDDGRMFRLGADLAAVSSATGTIGVAPKSFLWCANDARGAWSARCPS